MIDDIKEWLLLSSVPGVGSKRLKLLVENFGSPEDVLRADYQQLIASPKVDEKTAKNITTHRNWDFVTNQLQKAKEFDVEIIPFSDDRYPKSLLKIYDPPALLYVRGQVVKEDEIAIAIVGSRAPTVYGKTITEKFAFDFASRGITVISGMARGIDSQAHKGALKSGGRTIAVLGCGVDIVYPPENRKLLESITQNGAVVSEYPLGTIPMAANFPGRNRIISGLSLGLLVTEARMGSGALITVDFATEHGKEVFSVPGEINSKMSKGTNHLIKNGAKLVESIDDVLVELKPMIGLFPKQKTHVQQLNLPLEENTIFNLLSNEPIHIDKLSEKSGLPTQQILTILLSLELKGVVKSLSGKKFVAV